MSSLHSAIAASDLAAIAKAFAGNDFKPDHGFTPLFQRNLHLMNEVFAGFGALSFAIIRRWRGSRPDQLVCDVVASFGIWQSLNNADDDDSKINQSFFQYLMCMTSSSKFKNHHSAIVNQNAAVTNFSVWDFLKLAPMGQSPVVTKNTAEMLVDGDNETVLPDSGMAAMLRHRVRYFTDGAVIGSKAAFVNEAFDAARKRSTARRKDGARRMRGSGKQQQACCGACGT